MMGMRSKAVVICESGFKTRRRRCLLTLPEGPRESITVPRTLLRLLVVAEDELVYSKSKNEKNNYDNCSRTRIRIIFP